MGPRGVVVIDPGRDQIAGMGEVAEQRLVQELVPHPAIEAFHETVLHRLSGRDVVPFDLVLGAPLQDRVRGFSINSKAEGFCPALNIDDTASQAFSDS